jgi:hypothetical protein
MMQKMYRFADKGFHPIFMMMWYLEDQRFKSENDIRMNFNETQLIAHMKQAIQNKLPRQTPAMQKQVQTQVQSLVHTQVQVASPPLDPNNEIPWSFILPVFGIVVVAGTKYALGLGKNTRRKKRHSK